MLPGRGEVKTRVPGIGKATPCQRNLWRLSLVQPHPLWPTLKSTMNRLKWRVELLQPSLPLALPPESPLYTLFLGPWVLSPLAFPYAQIPATENLKGFTLCGDRCPLGCKDSSMSTECWGVGQIWTKSWLALPPSSWAKNNLF